PEPPPWWQRLLRAGEPRPREKADPAAHQNLTPAGAPAACRTPRDAAAQSEPANVPATPTAAPAAIPEQGGAQPASRPPAWHDALADAMLRGPQACGVERLAWSGPALATYLSATTGAAVSADPVRRQLHRLGYVC